MITALILIYTALIFALGLIVGKVYKKGEEAQKKVVSQTDFNSELINFLNYDGTNQ